MLDINFIGFGIIVLFSILLTILKSKIEKNKKRRYIRIKSEHNKVAIYKDKKCKKIIDIVSRPYFFREMYKKDGYQYIIVSKPYLKDGKLIED